MGLKYYFLLLLLLNFGFSYSQSKLPFDEDLLLKLTMDYNKDSIYPTYRKSNFVYLNIKTKDTLFNKKFKEAYPFVGNSALIFDENSNSYNIIDRKGDFKFKEGVLQKILETNHPHKSVIRFLKFENNSQQIFLYDLYESKIVNEYIKPNICAESVPPPVIEKLTNGKYSLILDNGEKVSYDFIKALNSYGYIVKKNNLFGAINYNTGKVIIPIRYDNYAEINTSQIIALKKGKLWYYYGFTLLKSKYLCSNFFPQDEFDKRFGIYKNQKGFNILFKDYSTLTHEFDWISDNGIIAKTKNNYYFIPFNTKKIVNYYER
ncbi:hypothetical protein SAMN05421639_104501 [Chryseobacterium shigense]|uniref:WG containing repeat-containing protein n=2 Tax=Chryseobacterium shigense TaxID=297244 RepID=A0A1N7ISD7_9FLAO|nr:hypothetical protein SAMN05421639_104501 [Chryseobacterium shigense]